MRFAIPEGQPLDNPVAQPSANAELSSPSNEDRPPPAAQGLPLVEHSDAPAQLGEACAAPPEQPAAAPASSAPALADLDGTAEAGGGRGASSWWHAALAGGALAAIIVPFGLTALF